MKISIPILLICLIVFSCSKNDDYDSWSPFGTITKDQRKKQDRLITILADTDTLGTNGKSLDTLYIRALKCKDGGVWQPCDSSRLDAPRDIFVVKPGDTVLLQNERLIFISEAKPIIFERLDGTPRDFPYMEFGRVIGERMVTCCTYLKVLKLDIVSKEIEVDFLETQIQLGT